MISPSSSIYTRVSGKRPDPAAAAAADMITVTTVVLCLFLAVTPAHYARKGFFGCRLK